MLNLKTFVVVVLAFAINASAQVAVGVNGGFNRADFAIDSDLETSGLTRFCFGVTLEDNVTGNLQVRVSPNYAGYGGKVAVGDLESVETKLGYFRLPVHAKYDVTVLGLGVYFVAGPDFGYNLKAEINNTDVSEDVHNFDFGASFGGGVVLPVAVFNRHVSVEANYYHGFSYINDGADAVQNRGVQVTAGFDLFDL